MRSDRIFATLFAFLLVNEMVAGFYRDLYEWWYLISKPLLMLSIIIYFVFQTVRFPHALRNWLLVGFVFSWLGDISLMFQREETFFLLGLASFLLAHVAYIMAFRLWVYDNLEIPMLKRHPWMAFALMLYGVGFFKILEPGLGEMKLPVIVYMAVIILMAIMALNRHRKVSRLGFLFVILGAVSFLLSDSILAYNKFAEDIPWSGVWIMLTYGFAQWAIMQGGVIELRNIGRSSKN